MLVLIEKTRIFADILRIENVGNVGTRSRSFYSTPTSRFDSGLPIFLTSTLDSGVSIFQNPTLNHDSDFSTPYDSDLLFLVRLGFDNDFMRSLHVCQ